MPSLAAYHRCGEKSVEFRRRGSDVKRAAVILLAANLLLLAWQFWARSPVAGEPERPRGVAVLQRVDPREVLSAQAPQRRQVTGPLACYALGPLQSASAASDALAWIRAAGGLGRTRSEQGDVWVGYWVVVAFEQTAAARSAMQTLKAAGISDAYVVADDNGNQLLSLGVFSEQARAKAQADRAGAAGYEADIRNRTRPGAVYYVSFAVPQDQADALRDYVADGRDGLLTIRECGPEDRGD